jgi:hypothetical protein
LIGTVVVEFDSLAKTAKAHLERVQTRAGFTNEASLKFTASTFNTLDETIGSNRYLNASFNVENLGASTLNNLSLIAYHRRKVGAVNVSGSAMFNIQDFGGGATDPLLVRPAHTMISNLGAVSVDSTKADMQIFNRGEVATLETDAGTAGLINAGVTGEGLLQYGYVVKNSGGGRAINAGSTNNTLNIGLRVPQSTDTTTTAYRFSMSFLAFEDPITRVTESLEEQGAGSTAQTRATALGASLQTMCGTSLSSGTYLTGIRTAGVGTDLAVIGGKFLVTNNTTPTFTVNGNIQKSFSSVNGLIDGRFQALMGATLSANLSGTPTNGSDVIINADGSLSINPKVNLRTTDGFNYNVSDGSCTSKLRPASISIQNAETWFVKNDIAISGDGRFTSPFKTLLEAQNISSTGDSIYVFNGDNTTTGQNAGITLKASQKLLGQGMALIVGGDTIVTAGLSAKIGNATGNGVTLNTNNELRGLDITTSGVGNNGISSSGFGTLTAGNVSISSSSGPALNLTNGTLNSTFTSISSSNSSTVGINLNNISGTLSIAGGSISGSSGVAFNAQGTLGTTSYAGSISKTSAGKVVSVSGATGGNLTLSGNLLCNTSCTGLDVLNNTAGTITFSGSSKSFNTGTNTAINLSSNTGATINFTNGGLAIATTSATGFNAIGGGNVSTQGSGNTISSGTGTALNVANTTIGASNLNFTSISANGGTNAIVLSNTGSSGGLTVTGTGTASSGGTIQNGVIGISLTNTRNVSLSRMQLSTLQFVVLQLPISL